MLLLHFSPCDCFSPIILPSSVNFPKSEPGFPQTKRCDEPRCLPIYGTVEPWTTTQVATAQAHFRRGFSINTVGSSHPWSQPNPIENFFRVPSCSFQLWVPNHGLPAPMENTVSHLQLEESADVKGPLQSQKLYSDFRLLAGGST